MTITVNPDGRLTITSTDTAALDRMEQLIEELSPPQRRFKVFRLNYIRAIDFYFDVLKDYFKEDLETKGDNEFHGLFLWSAVRKKRRQDGSHAFETQKIDAHLGSAE